jgi:hypothetical protein
MSETSDRKRGMPLPGVASFAAGSFLIIVGLLMAAIDHYSATHYSGLTQTYTLRGLLADLGLSMPARSGAGIGDWLLSQSAVAWLLVAGLALALSGAWLVRRGFGRP